MSRVASTAGLSSELTALLVFANSETARAEGYVGIRPILRTGASALLSGEIDVATSATGTAAPGAVTGERAEQADGPARRAAPPGDRGEEHEHERDRTNDGDQHDREHRRSQAARTSEEMLENRTAGKRRARRTRGFWRERALGRHRTLGTRRRHARITCSLVRAAVLPTAAAGSPVAYALSLGHDGGLGDGYRYTVTLTDLDDLGDAA